MALRYTPINFILLLAAALGLGLQWQLVRLSWTGGLPAYLDTQREQAAIGAFISLSEPTAPMLKEAATAGFYQPAHLPGLEFPRLQILTIEGLLGEKRLEYPRFAPDVTFKKAPRQRKGPAPEDKQNNLL